MHVLYYSYINTAHQCKKCLKPSWIESRPFFLCATLALTKSVEWLTSLCNYITITQRGYANYGFSKERSWSMVTRLATKLIEYVGASRIEVRSQLQVGNDITQVHLLSFWSIIQCLDRMLEIQDIFFSKHKSVANELVKFLTFNSGSSLNPSAVDMAKAVKTTENLGNKLDRLERTEAKFIAHIKRLEEKS